MPKNKWFVLSLGGSLIVPNGGIDVNFLTKFTNLIKKKVVQKDYHFFIICGGGSTARLYRDAGAAVLGRQIPEEDLDWLGTHATRLNAQLLRTIFKEITYQKVIKHYEFIDKQALDHKVVIAAGWKPGWSTDYDAVLLATDYRVTDTVINLSNIKGVYDKDPKSHKDARFFAKLTWEELRKIVGSKWNPGMNAPFDPVASQLAQQQGVKVIVCNGYDIQNLDNILEGKEFVGTTIDKV